MYGYGVVGSYLFKDILIFVAMLIIPLIVSGIVKSTCSKYAKRPSSSGLTAEEAARRILDGHGLYDVSVVHISGQADSCYYDGDKTVRLSDDVYGQSSVYAIGIAAHECGHACQFAKDYLPIKIRGVVYPVTAFCSRTWYWVFLAGCVFTFVPFLIKLAIALFAVSMIFQIVTLPIEFDASRRAMVILKHDEIVERSELSGVGSVLTACALTYVTGLALSALQLVRMLLRVRGRK